MNGGRIDNIVWKPKPPTVIHDHGRCIKFLGFLETELRVYVIDKKIRFRVQIIVETENSRVYVVVDV